MQNHGVRNDIMAKSAIEHDSGINNVSSCTKTIEEMVATFS